ncbi:MAG: hypothetical protein AAGJ29_02735 [Pseudomonadota bacterium]
MGLFVLVQSATAETVVRIHTPGSSDASLASVKRVNIRSVSQVGDPSVALPAPEPIVLEDLQLERVLFARRRACPKFLLRLGSEPPPDVRVIGDPCKATE